MPTHIAIIGPGAIGGSVAAWLAQSPDLQVTLCARTAFDRLIVDTPNGTIEAAPEIITEPAQVGHVDWVLIATKAYDAAGTGAWLQHLVGPATQVAVLQNGVEHVARFAAMVSAGRILPAVVDIPGERSAPGHIRQRRLGTIVVPEGQLGDAFLQLFAATPIAVSTSDDFETVAWTKLAFNCAGAISALLLKPGGVVWRDDIADIQRAMVRECVAVGRAEGAHLPDDLPDTVIAKNREAPRDSINSIHADRAAGRPMELEARNGVIVRLGQDHGIPTPVNAIIVALLKAAAE
ncbi:2-dehydropantoate 2-reductase [Sphingomonas sp. ASY06-1R]|uniref:2-dehydropantoate 2-reductase n=1 Tax=Sphingomonas sp. ASY06-1R TaxID=3445771 RepID=UPI003FA2D5F8